MTTPAAVLALTASPGTGRDHVRQHRSVLAGPEKKLLVWLARRMPARVNSDHLSALGLLSMVAVGLAFWLGGTHPAVGLPLVVVFLFLNWFGDSLDGTLARVRHCERPRYGFYVDHVIDMAGTTCMMAGLALSGFMSPLVALSVLVAWLLVAGESFLATHARGVFKMSFLWFGPTELRILMAAGAIKLMDGSLVSPFGLGPYPLFDVGAVIATAGLVVVFVVTGARNTAALYRDAEAS
jgi:archaetidylinositol phosphate synthase